MLSLPGQLVIGRMSSVDMSQAVVVEVGKLLAAAYLNHPTSIYLYNGLLEEERLKVLRFMMLSYVELMNEKKQEAVMYHATPGSQQQQPIMSCCFVREYAGIAPTQTISCPKRGEHPRKMLNLSHGVQPTTFDWMKKGLFHKVILKIGFANFQRVMDNAKTGHVLHTSFARRNFGRHKRIDLVATLPSQQVCVCVCVRACAAQLT